MDPTKLAGIRDWPSLTTVKQTQSFLITTEETAKLYIDNVFIQYGLPDVMISNRGPQFTSNIFNGIMDTLGINHRMSTAFHP